jgi:hypothetical protein
VRNTPLHRPSLLTPKSLRRILQITEGVTANIFHVINSLAVDAIRNGREQITTRQSRTGSRSSMPRRHSHEENGHPRQIAGDLAAPP